MATKSFLKNVDIKEKKLGKALVVALENASEKHSKNITLSRTYSDIHGNKIKELFGSK